MRILLTNDDGFGAPGLETLSQAIASLGEVYIVAPRHEWSGCGHRVTTHEVLRVESRGDRAFVVDGTPADCVRLALDRLVNDVDLVLSGINRGGNLGVDVFYSGTVAAAREASFHGKLGIALSHYLGRGLEIDWPRAGEWVKRVVSELLAQPRPNGMLWNVNLPHREDLREYPGYARAPVDPSPLELRFEPDGSGFRYRGDYHRRARKPGHDVEVCFAGKIAVSEL